MAGFLNVFEGEVIGGSWWYAKGWKGKKVQLQEFIESRPGKKIPLYAKGEAVFGMKKEEDGKFLYFKKKDIKVIEPTEKKTKK